MWECTHGSCPLKIHYWPFSKTISQKVNNPIWPLDDLWPHMCWCPMCDSTQGSLVQVSWYINVHGNNDKRKKKVNQKVNGPKMTFDPTSHGHTRVTPPKDHCIQVPWKYVKVPYVVDKVTFFKKKLNQRSLTPRWPLTWSLLRSHVWL